MAVVTGVMMMVLKCMFYTVLGEGWSEPLKGA